jgi:hypothetical protein
MTGAELDHIVSLYGKISMVEYTDDIGNECMYAILDNYLVDKLSDIYDKYHLKFDVIDLTIDVIMDNKIKTNFKDYNNQSVKKEIVKLIDEFKSNWITKDDILDKIIEKGIDSLTNFDLNVLKS